MTVLFRDFCRGGTLLQEEGRPHTSSNAGFECTSGWNQTSPENASTTISPSGIGWTRWRHPERPECLGQLHDVAANVLHLLGVLCLDGDKAISDEPAEVEW